MTEPLPTAVSRANGQATSRRRSLLALVGAAAGTAVVRPALVQAGKDARKARKRSRKKCRRQANQCRGVLTAFCTNGAVECPADKLAEVLACCAPLSTCKAGASLDCFFAT